LTSSSGVLQHKTLLSQATIRTSNCSSRQRQVMLTRLKPQLLLERISSIRGRSRVCCSSKARSSLSSAQRLDLLKQLRL
jgi:hypothetical protein